MQTPQYTDYQFVSAPLLTGAETQTAFSIEDITNTLFTTGLVNASALTFTESGLNVTATFGATVRVVFGGGAMAGGYGTVPGATSNVYTVNLASFVPGGGSTTVYIIATALQIGQQSVTITGPTPGHPDFDPSFIPYTFYTEQQDTVLVSAATSVPDNVTYIELCRVVLTAGEITIPSVDTSHQQWVGAVLSKGEAATNVGSLGGALSGTLPNPGLVAGSQTYATAGSYTFTVPSPTLNVEITGGGGGSGGCEGSLANTCGSPGGGGGKAIKRITGLTVGSSVTVTVGAGGSAGTVTPSFLNGGHGGTSSFGGYCSAGGGGGGQTTNNALPGSYAAGGAGSGGDINLIGGPGGLYWIGLGSAVTVAAAGTAPGNPPAQPGSGDGNGSNGANPGDGASGAVTATTTSHNGGAGASGLVYITWP